MATAEAPRASTASSESSLLRRGYLRLRRGTLLYALPALVLYGVFMLWPLLRVLSLSLFRWDGYGPQVFIGLSNYSNLWGDSIFRTSLSHSLLWEITAAILPTALGLGLALLLRSLTPAGRSSWLSAVFATIIFFPVLLPATAVAATWVLVYSPASGLLDALVSSVGLGNLVSGLLGDPHGALPALFVAWLWSALGVGTLLFWVGLSRIGREYIELALVEGAGPLWRFRHVLLPGLWRIGLIAALVNAALASQVFDLVYVTTGGGPGYATMLLPVDMYGRAFGGQTGAGAAVATIHVLLGLALAALVLLALHGREETLESTEGHALARRTTLIGTGSMILCVAVFALPVGWLIVVALGGVQLQPGLAAATSNPATWAWGNFSSAWDAGMAGAVTTSLMLAISAAIITMLLAAPAAFALSHRGLQRAWRLGVIALLVAGLFQPTPVLIIPLFSLLRNVSLLDTPWGVLLPEVARALPFGVLVLWGFLTALPSHVLEAAEVDGAAPWQQMVYVALPLVLPALAVVALWAFVGSWNEYLLPTLVSQDGSLTTVPTLLGTFVGRADTEYGQLAAGSLLAMLPALLICIGSLGPFGRRLSRVVRRGT